MFDSSYLTDARWLANHGIGRFSMEMLKGGGNKVVKGEFKDIFKILDPLYLFFSCAKNNSWFISPSYNCPAFWHSKSVITIHDLMHIHFPEYAGLKNKAYYQLLVKPVCKKSPLIFTVSEYTKQEIVKWAGVSPDKIVVVYNGVDEKYQPSVKPYQQTKPYLFYIGDKKPHKNIYRLLAAFAQSDAVNTHDLLLSGKEHEQIVSWAKELGISNQLKFSGFIPEDELPSYYKGATALMLPSLYEGFGLPIIEAMAVGTPVLTSNITSMPEVASGAALLVNPLEVNEISKGIDKLITDSDLRSQLIEKGLARVKLFNWDKSRQIWNDSINNVIGTK